jgi:metal-responsive CopG/Arc/MetJ family transcriptional regulator
MAKKVIQVPFDDDLLKEVNYVSKKKHKKRAELIREACKQYLLSIKNEELDRIYVRGYERIPEETDLGEAQVAILSEVLPPEEW